MNLLTKTHWRYLFFLILLIVIGISGIYYGIQLHRTNQDWTLRRTLSHIVKSNVQIPNHYFQGKRATPEVLEITMKDKNYSKLASKRADAWEKGIITKAEKTSYVPVKISHQGNKIKAKVKLKGLYLDHLHHNKWSLRVRIKGDNVLLGMKRFSLQAPHTRNFIHEWIYHQALRSVGLMALRFQFVNLHLNDKDLGIFSMEENFDANTAVNNQRAEGFFVKPMQNELSIYRESRIRKNPKLAEKITILNQDYQLFLAGKLKASELFNWEKTAKYFAVEDLFGAYHGDILGNFICYYNPVTLKLEPIGYDANAGETINSHQISPLSLAKSDLLFQRLFQDPIILAAYAKESKKLNPEWIESFLEGIDTGLQENLNIIYQEHPEYYFDVDYLIDNQKTIAKVLNEEIDTILTPTGKTAKYKQPIYPIKNYESLPSLLNKYSKKISSLPFITLNDKDKLILVNPGSHTLSEPLVIPAGYKFEITEGTSLNLTKNAVIYSNSPISFIGSSERPILITSSDGTGGGLVVMKAKEESILRHVIIEKQQTAVIGSFKPSGSVFFYESPVLIENNIIQNIEAEDGVNIVRSKFEIKNTVFKRCASDALDVDFGEGKVLDTAFIETGNDALDFSGSTIDLASINVQQAGDKGISAGENSKVQATNLRIIDTMIGLASKDLSVLHVNNSEIKKSNHCMAAYQKKPVFGQGKIIAESVIISECNESYSIEDGAMVIHEGVTIEPTIKNARNLFYGK